MRKSQKLTAYENVIDLPKTLDTILMLIILSLIPVFIILELSQGSRETILTILGSEILFVGLYALNHHGRHHEAAFGTFLIVTALLSHNLLFDNGLYDVSVLALPVLIVFSSFLMGSKSVVPITSTISAIIAVTYKLSSSGIVQPYDGALVTWEQDFYTTLAAILVTGLFTKIVMTILDRNVDQVLLSELNIKHTYENLLTGWAKALELRDQETEGHSHRAEVLTLELAKKMGIPKEQLRYVRWGALLHDIGKMGIPDSILLKPGQLTEAEFTIVKEHPLTAEKLLNNIKYLAPALDIPKYHHEKWDGSGYPHQLKGEEIPLSARIFAIVDVWDALSSERPYKPAWPKPEVIAHIKKDAGYHFDPAVVEAFLEIIKP